MLQRAVYESYIRPAILYGSEACYLNDSDMGILGRTERSMVRAMCGSTDLMFMLGLNDIMDQLAMANSVSWYGHVLRREDSHVLRRALDFLYFWSKEKGRLVEEESVTVGLRRKDALCCSKWSVGMNKIAAGLR